MDIGRISYQQFSNTAASPAAPANPGQPASVAADSFSKSEPAPSGLGISASEASAILLTKEGKINPADPFNFRKDEARVHAVEYSDKTETFFAGVQDSKNGKDYISSYHSDGRLKWKTEVKTSLYNLTPDNNGGITARNENTIYSFDNTGNKAWELTLPGSDKNFAEKPVVGNDNTVYFSAGKTGKPGNMSIAAVKDGKVKWTYDCSGSDRQGVELSLNKDGSLIFTETGLMDPSKADSSDNRKSSLVCLNPDGTLRFKKEFKPSMLSGAMQTQSPDGSIAFVTDDRKLAVISPDGKDINTLSFEKCIIKPPVADKDGNFLVVFGPGADFGNTEDPIPSSLACIDRNTGKPRWEQFLGGTAMSQALPEGGNVYIKISRDGEFDNPERMLRIKTDGTEARYIKMVDEQENLSVMPDGELVTVNGEKHTKTKLHYAAEKPETTQSNPKTPGKIEVETEFVVIGGIKLKKQK
ncbi:MAG: PQQ-binding-like beta-propeller repeat protein [Firmicutes bacterium]|nr:PQQ-binding-like beta-propeller repeat protein [Bacillota bacterium]